MKTYNTLNLVSHLKSKHAVEPAEYEKKGQKKGQPGAGSNFSSTSCNQTTDVGRESPAN